MVLNLTKLDLDPSNIKKQGAGYKVIDAIEDARSNHNTLVDALTTLSKQLDDISAKLDATSNVEIVQDVTNIKENIIPELKRSITKNVQLTEAMVEETSDELGLQYEQLEAHGRRLNVIVNGCREQKERINLQGGGTREFEDTEQLFRDFLVNSLKFSPGYVNNIILRDCHRLPQKRGSAHPPPIIAAFICQKHRNEVLSAAKHLKGTNLSIKSDLPKRLNTIRSSMLKVRADLKKEKKIVRLVERNYLPMLQQQDSHKKWNTIYDVKGEKALIGIPAFADFRLPAGENVVEPVEVEVPEM